MATPPLCRVLLLPLLPGIVLAQEPFRTSRNLTLPPITVGYDVTAGDIDGDGDLDLVIANDHDPNQLFLNDGRGAFTDKTAGRLTTPGPIPGQAFSNATYAVDLADIDGDGDLDLLVCNDHWLADRVHVNDGTGVFTDVSATALPPNADYSVDQVVADFDGDGDVDWFAQHGSHARLYLNDGTGVFADATATNLPPAVSFPLAAFYHTGCSAADLDQDGDLDLLVPSGNGPSYTPRILVNGGNAVFVPAPAGTIPSQYTGTTYAADLDGDDLPEIITGSGRYVLPNLGGMTFGPAIPLAGNTVLAFDYDEDGDLDPIDYGAVRRNDGQGTFTTLPMSPMFLRPGKHCIADLDGDRDLDLVTPTGLGANFLRQVHANAAPALGQPFTVDFHGPTDSPFLLGLAAVAITDAAIPVPSLGTLRLDPATTSMLPILYPTGGLAQVTLSIPNAPNLAGLELHYQALVVDPLRPPFLGNAIREVIQ